MYIHVRSSRVLPARYTTRPDLHAAWRLVAWVVRRGGSATWAAVAGALTDCGLREAVFRFFLGEPGGTRGIRAVEERCFEEVVERSTNRGVSM